MTRERRNLAVLVGNGLSIAFNPELNLRSITAEVMARIGHAEGGDVVAAMREMAERALPDGVRSDEDFEQLVGAFGSETRSLGSLEELASLKSPQDTALREAIQRTTAFAEQVRDNGISHVLEVICERSHAYVAEAENLRALLLAVVGAFEGEVAFGNLNYDTLLLAGLLQVCPSNHVADLGHGFRRVSVLVNEEQTIRVPALRETKEDFPDDRRIRMLHLHGSLTYWRKPATRIFAKMPKEILEDGTQWRAIREQTTDVRPVVVLANPRDKADHVSEYPFALAYEVFAEGLDRADHWLVIGYSFKDEPVNGRLRNAFLEREVKPKMLVVTHGDSPSRVVVERALGWGADDGDSSAWLTINREGANGIQETTDWATFAAGAAPLPNS